MSPFATLGLSAFALLVSALPASAGGATTILDCNFDAETLDALAGMGGAAAGQLYSLGGTPAYIRSTPFATPSLEISDDSSVTAETVRFQFLNDWEIDSGVLTISMNLWFHEFEQYVAYVREANTSGTSFLNLGFTATGNVRYGDLDSPGSTVVGTYTTGESLALVITFDLDTATYDVTLGGSAILTDESLGSVPRGIGAILLGTDFDSNMAGLYSVDDVVVTATELPSPVESTRWSDVKAAWRGE